MRNAVAMVSFAALLTSAAPASAGWGLSRTAHDFDVRECAANATHILVLNPQGSVLEVWKGDVRLGEVIPIHTLANLTLTQSCRSDGAAGFFGQPASVSFSSWSSAGCERLIVFLIKSDAPDPTNGLLKGWRPASKAGFDHSVATVRWCGSVFVEPRPAIFCVTGMADYGLRGSEAGFKERVFWALKQPQLTARNDP